MGSETATLTHSFGFGEQPDLRGTLYESEIPVDLGLRKLSKGQKYHLVLHLVNDLPNSLRQELLSDLGGLVEPGNKLSQLKLVQAAAQSFGNRVFNLDQICARLGEEFPGTKLSRQTIVRRLYDLQKVSPPLIEKVRLGSLDEISDGSRTGYRYRVTGPPAGSPQTGSFPAGQTGEQK